jgi:putative endonuclease
MGLGARRDGGRWDRGEAGEEAAVALLQREGYRIVARNFSCRYGELDVVAEKGEVLAFVEVRMRSSAVWGDPSHTVSFAKQRRVVKAALHFLFRSGLQGRMVRFDVVTVVGRGDAARVEHLPAAFDAGM